MILTSQQSIYFIHIVFHEGVCGNLIYPVGIAAVPVRIVFLDNDNRLNSGWAFPKIPCKQRTFLIQIIRLKENGFPGVTLVGAFPDMACCSVSSP